jgi:hypothetical protein
MNDFRPVGGLKALLDQIYDLKFSKHVPLVVVLLSGIFTMYRSHHYLSVEFRLPELVSVPTAIFVELLVLGASASIFITQRDHFLAQLKGEDTELAVAGLYTPVIALGVSFFVMLGVAAADAWLLTSDVVATLLMLFIQAAQGLFIVSFIISALLDERSKLRKEYTAWSKSEQQRLDQERREEAEREARECPYCLRPVAPQNRARHVRRCPKRPELV